MSVPVAVIFPCRVFQITGHIDSGFPESRIAARLRLKNIQQYQWFAGKPKLAFPLR
ncbi:hypothetical protein BRPE64_ACDS01780 [Caballeronia insecticola]|uniref:Uncharacterized protein n=1 Tax=Caballeronia insecticola TaxID=758793 RepID=R4WVK5_9BURK|nr:hypothetical protein BRPE64_ACDS01780 [Caballeronia insecticola]